MRTAFAVRTLIFLGGYMEGAKYPENSTCIAINLINDYPLTRFMRDRQVDYSTSLIRAGVNVNICLVGFGKINCAVMKVLFANSVFLGAGLKQLPLRYHIFDTDHTNGKRLMENSFYRLKGLLQTANRAEYLPMPYLPAEEFYYPLDVCTDSFLIELERIVTAGENDLNIVIISLGDENKNLAVARTISCKNAQWGGKIDAIFVRCRKDITLCGAIAFGRDGEKWCGEHGEPLYKMACVRSAMHNLSSAQITNAERYSALFGCLALRSKLNLMGLDVSYGKEGEAIGDEEYNAIYLPLRDTMTYHEHARWNAYVIAEGIVPATRAQILGEHVEEKGAIRYTNGKNYAEGRHGNITTFEGLREFSRIVAARDGVLEEERDVIKYDAMLLDCAPELIKAAGGKIVKLKKCS